MKEIQVLFALYVMLSLILDFLKKVLEICTIVVYQMINKSLSVAVYFFFIFLEFFLGFKQLVLGDLVNG